MNTNNGKVAQNAGKAGVTHANGFKVASVKVASTVNQYCFKCGKLKSEHKLFQGCPKV